MVELTEQLFFADGDNNIAKTALWQKKTPMKKAALLAAMCIAMLGATAQAWIPKQQMAQASAEQSRSHYNVTFESRRGEAFTVFIDGDPANRMPQGRVMVNDISRQVHEVVVVLRRPAEKAAVLRFIPGETNAVVNVDYDEASGYLHLYTAPCNRPDAAPDRPARATSPRVPQPVFDGDNVTMIVGDMPTQLATDEQVVEMVVQLKAVPFDSDRLALARTLLATSLFNSSQIARLAQTIDYSNSQVEFLKYAYHHCSDPRNYNRAIEVLTFSSDRKKVTDYIATQR